MNKSASAKIFSVISAVCFVILVAWEIFLAVLYEYTISFITIISCIIWLAYAVLLFLQKKNIVFVIVGIANVLLEMYYFVDMLQSVTTAYYISTVNKMRVLNYFLYFLCAATILIIILFNCLPSLQGKRKVVSRLWFLPGVFMAVGNLIMWRQWAWDYFKYYPTSLAYVSIVISIIEVLAYIMFGLWLYRSPEIKDNTKVTSVNEYATFNPQNINASPPISSAIGGADKLKEFKELLDMGAITQEEFDAKKKQILGL